MAQIHVTMSARWDQVMKVTVIADNMRNGVDRACVLFAEKFKGDPWRLKAKGPGADAQDNDHRTH